jgi:hypothetical protein
MKRRTLQSSLVAVPALVALAGAASAADLTVIGPSAAPPPVVVEQPPVVQPQPPVVVQPAPSGSTVVVTPGSPQAAVGVQSLLADGIQANQVHAQTIYANRIRAREVQGTVHQIKDKIGSGKHDIKAPIVTASVIYADEIRADTVSAGDIYVRDLTRE